MRIAHIAVVLLLATVGVADAQTPPAALRRRMRDFTTALREQAPMGSIASFFPRGASWEFVDTQMRAGRAPIVARHHFGANQTLAAISKGGEICNSFGGSAGDIGPMETALVMQAELPWRYAGRNRFVPRGHRADSPSFVEWTREGGAWVIARIGEESEYVPNVLGTLAAPIATRDTLEGVGLPAARRYATRAAWYASHIPIYFESNGYLKYGLPRALPDGDLARLGSVGVVPVFIERDLEGMPDVLYVLVGPGEYQPYQYFIESTCRT